MRWHGCISAQAGDLPEHLPDQTSSAGGILGLALGSFLFGVFGYAGSTLLMLAMLLAGMTLYSGMSWLWLIEKNRIYYIKNYR